MSSLNGQPYLGKYIIMDWFTELVWFHKIFWIIALIGSVFFLIMLVATFIGGDVDGEIGEVDFDSGGFHFFTIKNLIAFFTIFGWAGIAAIEADLSKGLVILIAFVSGFMMMLVMATLFYFISKLNDSGTLITSNAVGTIGDVYLTLGKNRSKIGKVNIKIQGAIRELEALTDEEDDLKQGTVIKVLEVTNNGILIVEKHRN